MGAAKRVWVQVALVAAGLALLFVVAQLAGHAWAVQRAADWRVGVEAELRAQAAARLDWRLPPLADDPGNEATCDSAAMSMAAARDVPPPRPEERSTLELPLLVTDWRAGAWLDRHDEANPALIQLEVALCCTRLPAARHDAPYWMRTHAEALLLEASWARAGRALAGSSGPPAAESALLLLRLALIRIAEGQPGLYDAERALITLARIVASRAAGMDPGRIGAQLAALEQAMPRADPQVSDRRDQLLPLARDVGEAQLPSHQEIQSRSWSPLDRALVSAARALVPDAALQVLALEHADRYLRDAGAALDADDSAALEAARAASRGGAEGWNVATRLLPGYQPWNAIGRRHLRAALALARAALRLEEARLRDGAYPQGLPEDPRLRDPFGHGPLRYQTIADRRAYRLWTVGDDGVDAGGGFGEVVVEAPEVTP